MFAIDALYDDEDPNSTEKYKGACEELWTTVQGLSRTPVAHIENMKSKVALLTAEISQLKVNLYLESTNSLRNVSQLSLKII